MDAQGNREPHLWPALPFAQWQETCATLHMWTQVVGKIRLALAPMVNHWWQVPLYVTTSGLTTSLMPWKSRGVQIDFDFCKHRLVITTSDERRSEFALSPMSVAQFYHDTMSALRDLDIDVAIWTMPVEVADAIPFELDQTHKSYDAQAAQRFWRVLLQADRVMHAFRGRYIGKVSPVHFFWGSFDLAVTRFSGRTAPPHPGGAPHLGDWVVQEAYSHEVSSCGFWPGNGGFGRPAFYAYAYPEPFGFSDARVQPSGAAYDPNLREFVLDYDIVRRSDTPDAALLAFFQTSYEAAARAGHWDRAALER